MTTDPNRLTQERSGRRLPSTRFTSGTSSLNDTLSPSISGSSMRYSSALPLSFIYFSNPLEQVRKCFASSLWSPPIFLPPSTEKSPDERGCTTWRSGSPSMTPISLRTYRFKMISLSSAFPSQVNGCSMMSSRNWLPGSNASQYAASARLPNSVKSAPLIKNCIPVPFMLISSLC